MIKIKKATKEEQELIIKIANDTFKPIRPIGFDFRSCQPKVYSNPNYDFSLNHYLAKTEEDTPVATFGNLIYKTSIDDNDYSFSFLGSVSVLPEYQSQGIMKEMMNQLEIDNLDHHVVFSLLTGKRKRYQNYGYEKGPFSYAFNFVDYTIHHFRDTKEVTLEEIDARNQHEAYKLYKNQDTFKLRDPSNFYLSLKTGEATGYNLYNQQHSFIGYCSLSKAKKEIFDGMAPGAQAVLCGDDDFLPQIRQDPEMAAAYSIFYAGQSELCDYRAADVHVEITGTEKEGEVLMNTVCSLTFPGVKEPLELCIPAAGRHLIYPASLAAAVGSLLGMTAAEIREGIGAFAGQRMPCEKYGEILIFDDTYNASPESMKSSLEVLSCVPMPRKAAVLGDMLEQGEYAEKLHRETGAAAAQAGIDTLITVGPLSSFIADEARACGLADVRAFPDRESAADAVRQITRPGTAILFKASHGMALDKLAAISRETAGK